MASLCLAVIVALPAATPKEYKNTASYAFGNFMNRTSSSILNIVHMNCLIPCIVNGWPNGFAFIISFMAPLWTICTHMQTCFGVVSDGQSAGSFDSAVHISEEASNAAIAVPWAIVCPASPYFPHDPDRLQVCSIAISGVLGLGVSPPSSFLVIVHLSYLCCISAINIALAFCMGTDIEYLLSSPIGQPMAQIFFNSFGERGTLALWSFVVVAQYVHSAILCMSPLITFPLGT